VIAPGAGGRIITIASIPRAAVRQDRYTPEEEAELLGIGLNVVWRAAFTGGLCAQIEGHDIIRLDREDVPAGLGTGEEPEGEGPADTIDSSAVRRPRGIFETVIMPCDRPPHAEFTIL
jgi:hypothetical protein